MLLIVGITSADERIIQREMTHVRNGDVREWSDFPEKSENERLIQTFQASANSTEYSLRILQQDIKQQWDIRLNDQKLGQLHRDENAIEGYWSIPGGLLQDGENTLEISTTSRVPDDIRLGRISIFDAAVRAYLGEHEFSAVVRDADRAALLPSRLTILRDDVLMTTGNESGDGMAVRPGVIYCRGRAQVRLPAGTYTVIAGRGPEYAIQSKVIALPRDAGKEVEFRLAREVSTAGMVSCDTHVHTLTHSGHGDASIRERMLTLAGECIELPIATDHNRHIDYTSIAENEGVRAFFTPVIGNEFTTKIGHFNIFPVESSDTEIPNHTADNWPDLFAEIFRTPNVKVAILNHARDIHSGYRPFGPKHFVAPVARNADGWDLRANAMEVINSAAQQTDMMTLVHDWMAHLNAGRFLTPVGSSDSHDVARHFVGHGRTLIRCSDDNVARIDIESAVRSFLAGRVVVSCGLLADIRVTGLTSVDKASGNDVNKSRIDSATPSKLPNTAGPGDLARSFARYKVEVDAIGPSWMEAHEVEVFVNGQSVQTTELDPPNRSLPGVKQTVTLTLDLPRQQDAFVVAVVRGPGVTQLYWPVAKPYQPTSADWTPQFMAVTGAVWLDRDSDGKRTSARTYARRVCEAQNFDSAAVISELKNYDASVCLHAADLLYLKDSDRFRSQGLAAAHRASSTVSDAFDEYYDAVQQSQRAQVRGE